MADNVAITAGSGTNIATDDVAGTHYQRMKLVDGTLDSTTAIAAGGGVEAGALRVTVASDSTGVLSVDDNGGSLTVDGTVTANAGTGSFTVAQATAGNLNATVVGSGNFTVVQSTAGNLNATVTGTVTANAGTGSFTVAQATAGNLNATVTGFATSTTAAFVKITDGTNTATVNANGGLEVTGGVAHGGTDAGNPLKLGAKAEASVTSSANVTDGQRTDLYADLDGVFLTKPFIPYGDIKVERVTDTGGTSTAFTTFGATASQRNYITTITVYNSSTTQGFIDLRDGTGGSVIYTIPLPALGGATINFPVPLRQATVNTALAYDVSAAITTAYISVVGFKGY